MNRSRHFGPLLGFAAALGSLFVIASILLGHGNQFAALLRYLLIVGFAVGLLFPRGALITCLVFCGYADLLKRLMVVFDRVQYSDLYSVLGIPPVMLLGVTIALLLGNVTRRFEFEKNHWRLLALSCGIIFAGVLLSAREQGLSLAALAPGIANDGSYAMLVFVVPVIFRDTDEMLKLLKILLWCYAPAALYGVIQQLYGFQPFEIAYLKTGLTLEIKQLYSTEVRPFSTLNSPTAFSVVCGMMAVFTVILAFTPRRRGDGRILTPGAGVFFFTIFMAGLIASTSRSALLLTLIGPVGFLCFRSAAATRWLYATLGAGFMLLVLFASVLLSNLGDLQSEISGVAGEGQLASQLSRVGTFGDRLHGFANLATNPEVYTLFGYGTERGSDERDPLYAHDMVSNLIVTHGLVVFVLIVIVLVIALTRMHRRVLQLGDRHHRLLAAGFTALAFSVFALSAVSGSVIGTFPVNTLLWLSLGLLMLVYQSETLHRGDPTAVPPETLPDAETQHTPRRAIPFTRSGRPVMDHRFQ
jgi:hypothetical protein